MKKIMATVIAGALTLSTVSAAFAAESDYEKSKYKFEIDELKKLEIINGYPGGDYRPDSLITKAEFMAMFSRLVGMEKMDTTQSAFADISNEHWALGYVNFCYDRGYIDIFNMLEDEEKTEVPPRLTLSAEEITENFMPNEIIKLENAVHLLVEELGYDTHAEYMGGALNVASTMGLLDGFSEEDIENNGYFTREKAAKLIYNALNTPIVKESALKFDSKGEPYAELTIMNGENGVELITLYTIHFEEKTEE